MSKMVRRIIYDSDFEEEDMSRRASGEQGGEKSGVFDAATVSSAQENVLPVNSPVSIAVPRSVRKVIRQRDLELSEVGRYDYDSDIYTEESSMGSFIVDSDNDDESQSVEDKSGMSP